MAQAESVSTWIEQLQAGAPEAAQRLWEQYFPKLVRLAGAKLADVPRLRNDAEDVALSAFASFCRAAEEGRFPTLSDRNGLWHLLVVITARKAISLRRHHARAKRGGGVHLRDQAAHDLQHTVGAEPTPDFAAQVAEEYRRLLELLGDDQLRQVAIWKMEGYTVTEMSQRLKKTTRTIERKLHLIRDIWTAESDEGAAETGGGAMAFNPASPRCPPGLGSPLPGGPNPRDG